MLEFFGVIWNNPVVNTIGAISVSLLGTGLLWKLSDIIWTNFKIKNQIQQALDKRLLDPLAEFLADQAVAQVNKIPNDQICKDTGLLIMETPNRFDAVFDARFLLKWRIKP